MWVSLHQQLRNRNLTHFAHITDEEFKAQGVWLTGRTVASLPQSVSSPTNAVMIAFLTCGLHLSEQLLILQPFLKWHDFKVWPTHTHHFYKLWDAWASLVAQKIWLRRICLQCGRPRFDPCVRKILWRTKWPPIPVFLPGESHGPMSLVDYSPWGHQESYITKWLTHTLYSGKMIIPPIAPSFFSSPVPSFWTSSHLKRSK